MNSEKENKTSPDFVQKLNTSNESKVIKWILIAVSVLFLFVMLVLPLYTVVSESLKKGFQFYIQSISDEYTLRALLLTVKATVAAVIVNTVFGLFAAWALTKFRFKGNHADRHSNHGVSGYRRSDLPLIIWKKQRVVSVAGSDQF